MAPPRKRLGELLVEAGVLDPMQLTAALGYQRQWGGKLGSVLVERGFISEGKLVETLAQQLKVPVVQITKTRVDARAVQLLPAAVAEQLHVFPLELKGSDKTETLVVAMCDPTDLAAVDQLQFRTRRRIQTVLAGEKDIKSAIRRHYYNEDAPPPDDDRRPPPVAAPPQKMPDAHMLSGGPDRVPGLMSWGGGDANATTLPPQNQQQGQQAPQPVPVAQPMYAQPYYGAPQVPYATAYPAPQGAPMVPQMAGVPVGVPPGFAQSGAMRGRPMPSNIGAPAMPRSPASRAPATVDPFADDADPLAGVDPADSRAPKSLSFDPLEDSNDDSWKSAIEPIAATIAHDPLAGTDPLGNDDPFADVHGTPAPAAQAPLQVSSGDDGEDLEMLDVEVEPLEEDAAQKSPRAKSAEDAIDAAAEGWLTPAEEGEPAREALSAPPENDEDPWRTVSETPEEEGSVEANAQAVEDPWATPSDEPPAAAPAEEPVASWGDGEAQADEQATSWETPAEDEAAPQAEAEATSEEQPAGEDEWVERAAHEPTAEPEAADTSWLEPVAATIGHEPPPEVAAEPAEEAIELDAPSASAEAAAEWGEATDEEQPAAAEAAAEWGETSAEEQPVAAAEDGWTTESEQAEEPPAEQGEAAAEDGWTTTSEAAEEPAVEEPAAEAGAWAAAPETTEEPQAQAEEDPWATGAEAPEQTSVDAPVEVAAPPADEEPEAESAWDTGVAEEESLSDWVGGADKAAEVADAVPEATSAAEIAPAAPAEQMSWDDVAADDEAPKEPEPPANEWGAANAEVTAETPAAAPDEEAAAAWAATDEPAASTETEVVVEEAWSEPPASPPPPAEITSEAAAWASADEEVTPRPDEPPVAAASDWGSEPPASPDEGVAAEPWAEAAPAPESAAADWAENTPAEPEGEDVPIDDDTAGEWAAGQASEPDTQPPPTAPAVEATAEEPKPEGSDEWAGFGFADPPANGAAAAAAAPADNHAAALRGWSLVGVEHPTADDAVQTMGVLLDMLVAKGALDPAEFGRALREARSRASQ